MKLHSIQTQLIANLGKYHFTIYKDFNTPIESFFRLWTVYNHFFSKRLISIFGTIWIIIRSIFLLFRQISNLCLLLVFGIYSKKKSLKISKWHRLDMDPLESWWTVSQLTLAASSSSLWLSREKHQQQEDQAHRDTIYFKFLKILKQNYILRITLNNIC